MTTPKGDLSHGAVKIYHEEILGVGSYGKVCKAKCGQLPCAAKLLHDTMFGNNDPGIQRFVGRFEQECQFLKMISHPNIVQFLGTVRDPRSGRLGLLMELMDESLTRFLERSNGPLPYHIQLNIGQEVALALAYLHSNDIVHRDLSSNNVLLIGEGTRAKVTDLGMSTLIGMKAVLTMSPGCPAYMPPEALITPPEYSSKLDCFSHGVLTIQIATRQFPNPGDARKSVDVPGYSAGTLFTPVPEVERRKKHIDQVDPDNPLLPLALNCLKDSDTERPSADELCGKLASLKCEPKYTHSVEQYPSARLQQQVLEKDAELARAQTNHEIELQKSAKLIQEKDAELTRLEAKVKVVAEECERLKEQLHKQDHGLLQKQGIVQPVPPYRKLKVILHNSQV